ncbi:hypothetical protein EI74_0474 [Mycoplasma testudineum]|uniref:Uncharacterized protein n=1 Tax=Mycoplasma testudineum TaxID=244584 RepID=A0A4R6IF47_9MOLU|nr:hypothetical protein [Mycoplasma testudineum]OYD26861.1 hypothetical protein CG473_01990 [Mycoplasma testudineum]TDO20396.1 hypothetical protein EI74_0474 [Mycoplasma testudineum]
MNEKDEIIVISKDNLIKIIENSENENIELSWDPNGNNHQIWAQFKNNNAQRPKMDPELEPLQLEIDNADAVRQIQKMLEKVILEIQVLEISEAKRESLLFNVAELSVMTLNQLVTTFDNYNFNMELMQKRIRLLKKRTKRETIYVNPFTNN